eukprot:m.69417 g.69417  ORF g.69417 m.69417 type:complete len:723 (+) comp12056_c0_seq1:192-2360(+)
MSTVASDSDHTKSDDSLSDNNTRFDPQLDEREDHRVASALDVHENNSHGSGNSSGRIEGQRRARETASNRGHSLVDGRLQSRQSEPTRSHIHQSQERPVIGESEARDHEDEVNEHEVQVVGGERQNILANIAFRRLALPNAVFQGILSLTSHIFSGLTQESITDIAHIIQETTVDNRIIGDPAIKAMDRLLSCCSRRRESFGDLPETARVRRIRNLIWASLVELPRLTAETHESAMGSLDELGEISEEGNWMEIACEIVSIVPLNNPLACACITIMMDTLDSPARDDLAHFSEQIESIYHMLSRPTQLRNLLVVWAFLGYRHAGHHSEFLFNEFTFQCILNVLKNESEHFPEVTLFALIALEKFAATRANKEKMLASEVIDVLVKIEEKYCCKSNMQSRTGPSTVSSELRRAEIGFVVMWMLDNVLPCSGRPYTIERVDLTGVKVMLDVEDATRELKLAPDGLEARNDALNFGSVRATCCTMDPGLYFYEVTVFTSGIMQIGWATEHCAYKSEEGIGIGDDLHSFAYDGGRGLLWYNQITKAHEHRTWRPGDVLGLLFDTKGLKINFSLNGQLLPHWLLFPGSRDNLHFYPAASLMTFQHLQFNFGNAEYKYPPKLPFRSLNETASGFGKEKMIVPRLIILEQLQRERQEEDHTERCQICFDSLPNVVLHPCKHQDFCRDCVARCQTCPLCRADIEDMTTYESNETESSMPNEEEAISVNNP